MVKGTVFASSKLQKDYCLSESYQCQAMSSLFQDDTAMFRIVTEKHKKTKKKKFVLNF